ncbi:hypothetical protein [Actinomadura madurae]|uniref:hypothetical protein n=1 Tax=Actinomadura madurae TaxID=1993 RepID=UPI0020D22714|nr:hypothetical protein [Actinomadura madurae]MCP9981582.1 hypothetical protein [Actinomadura madurae]
MLTIGPGWTFLPDAASFAASAALLAMTRVRHVPPLVIGAYGLALTGLGVLNPTWETVVQMSIPPQALARVTSYDWLLSLAAAPLGYALAPWAASNWNASAPLWTAAVLVAASCLATAAVPGVRRLTMPEPTPLAASP